MEAGWQLGLRGRQQGRRQLPPGSGGVGAGACRRPIDALIAGLRCFLYYVAPDARLSEPGAEGPLGPAHPGACTAPAPPPAHPCTV